MERWTSRDESGYYYLRRIHRGKYEPTKKDLIQRVGQYEDTGLEPEAAEAMKIAMMGKAIAEIKEFDGVPIDRLRELAQAEKDGRLAVLPCKLHEPIFYIENGEWFYDIPHEAYLGQRAGEWNDTLLFLCQDGFSFYEEDFGKTVFLTREEAEAALKGDAHETNSV